MMSPEINWTNAPAGTMSFVLHMNDSDFSRNKTTEGMLHWLVWNIDPKTNSIAEGSAPKGVQGTNDFGRTGYGAPCPPSGTHRYVFKIFALDRALDLPAGAKRSQLDLQMRGHITAQGELMGRFARNK
jgi:Raf kinase inhibitor-like YbhB/YbcL family protein